jgi:pyrimidine operon attenuation protein/uracil phosphoribosyltransferase
MKIKSTTRLLDKTDISRMILRLTHEIVEKNTNPDDIVLIGILSRGEPLAHRIKKNIRKLAQKNVELGTVNISFHRDDFMERLVVPQVKGTDITFNLDKKTVILVDDVLYTGRTIRAAIDEILSFGRPSKIQLAVLVDRGHREMPIKADYVGKNIPTNEGEHVNVYLQEVDGKDLVELRQYSKEKNNAE